jgi:hypothetical protein
VRGRGRPFPGRMLQNGRENRRICRGKLFREQNSEMSARLRCAGLGPCSRPGAVLARRRWRVRTSSGDCPSANEGAQGCLIVALAISSTKIFFVLLANAQKPLYCLPAATVGLDPPCREGALHTYRNLMARDRSRAEDNAMNQPVYQACLRRARKGAFLFFREKSHA